jgi:hypothetical protein
MATYLQGGVDFLPQETLFTPNWSLIQQGLITKQGAYDKGFAQISNAARNVIDAPLTNKYTKGMRKQILADAEQALKDLPNMDLTLPQNVGAATSLFKPFYQNDSILYDMMETKRYMSERQRGAALATSAKEEERNRYWSEGIQDLDDWAEEFSNLEVKDLTKLPSRRYVSKPNVDDQILKLFSEGKLKTTYDVLSGQYKYTYENGEALKIPITNLYLAMAENDPEAMAGYQVIGRVRRNRFIRENEQRLGSRQAAQEAFDNALANDYFNGQKSIYDQTNDALTSLQASYDAYKMKVDNNQVVVGSPEYARAIETVKQYDQLKARRDKLAGDIFSVAGKPPAYLERITGNPTAYLANVYLNKSAIDLAASLSQFGGRKVDINPVWEKAQLPFLLKEAELQKAKQLETFKTDELLRAEEGKIQLKIKYGIPLSDGTSSSTSTSTGSTSIGSGGVLGGNINIPTVTETASGAAAYPVKDDAGQPDVDGQYTELTKTLASEVVSSKLRFIETMLKPEEIKTIDGVTIPPDQRSNMLNMKINSKLLSAPQGPTSVGLPKLDLSSGRKWGLNLLEGRTPQQTSVPTLQTARHRFDNEFDRLYNIAMEKYKAMGEANVKTNEYDVAARLVEQINIKNDAWTAAIQWRKEKMSQVVGNLSGSDPVQGFVYKGMYDGADVVPNKERFIENLTNNADFAAAVKAAAPEVSAMGANWLARFGNSPVNPQLKNYYLQLRDKPEEIIRNLILTGNDPTVGQSANILPSSLRSLFNIGSQYDKFKEKIRQTWNKGGNEFNYFSTFGKKGGGVYSRQLTFYGDNTAMGEKADQYTESLIGTISMYDTNGTYSDDKVRIKFGDASSLGNSSTAEALFIKLKPEILNTIKLGKGKDGQTIPKYQFRSQQIAGNDAEWAAYTLTGFDNEWIDKNTATSQTPGLLTKNEAASLRQGITIFVKKDVDKSLAALNSTVGEVEMLLNAGDGTFKRELAPGYGVQISRLSTGGYKIETTVEQNTVVNGIVQTTPVVKTQTLDESTDLTEAYYQVLNILRNTRLQNEDIKRRLESSRTANPAIPKATWNDINNAAKQ